MKRTFFFLMLAAVLSPLNLNSCRQRSAETEETPSPFLSLTPLSATNLRKVVFLPYWVANAQFAGYYMAREMGIYRKYGMEVEIPHYQPFHTTSELIRSGEVDFAGMWLLNAIETKASGVDIVNIAQFSTRSSLMLVTKKSSGINTLEDMNHKRIGIWSGYELQPRALFKKYNLDVEIIPIGSTNNLFLKDAVKITNASWFDEYHTIINSGYDPEDLNTFFFADYGLNFLEDGIYCLSDKVQQDPELCANFVTATEEGWLFAYANPEKTLDVVVAYAQEANLPVNRVHQRWMLDRYRDLYGTENVSTILSEEDYYFAANVLKESGQITAIPPFNDFFQHYDTTKVQQFK